MRTITKYYLLYFIITRYWKPVCSAAWILFIVYEGLIGYDRYYSKYPLCPHSDFTDQWYLHASVSTFIGFVLTLLIVCMRIVKIDNDIERLPYLVILNIIVISTIGTMLSVFFNWGGMCLDSLG